MIRNEKEEQIQGEINALQNLLEQRDYTSRKVAFEVAEVLKAKFPEIEMPIFEHYQAGEEQAKQFRARIAELQKQLEG